MTCGITRHVRLPHFLLPLPLPLPRPLPRPLPLPLPLPLHLHMAVMSTAFNLITHETKQLTGELVQRFMQVIDIV